MYGDDETEPAITIERCAERASITLRGDLDMQVEDVVTRTISAAASDPSIAEIQIDAVAVMFIDSSGLRALLVSRQVAQDRGLAYSIRVAAPGPVQRLIAITGLEEVLVAEPVPAEQLNEMGANVFAG
jgi:anti-anti-sigma factor